MNLRLYLPFTLSYIAVAFDAVSAYPVQLKAFSTDTTPFGDVATKLDINNDLAMCSSHDRQERVSGACL